MIETGVNLSLQDNMSASSRRISDELDGIARSADGVNSAFDSRILDEYDKKLTQIGESYSKLNNQVGRQEQAQSARSRQIVGLTNAAGTSITSAGRGDVAGAGLAAGKGLSTLLGGPAALVTGIGLAGGVATNALANQYEERAGYSNKIAAMQDKYFTDIDENTEALRGTMQQTTDAVAKYGKTFEEGSRAQEQFIRAGGTDFSGSRAGAYSMAYGADFSNLAQFAGTTQRYGQTGGLDVTRALMRSQGIAPGQFEEVMGGIQDTFSASLSRGIVRSVQDIARSQEFFSRAGVTFQGGLGAQRLQGMNQAVSGAAGLNNQSDLFLYRAAAGISGGGLLETRKLMEQGLTPELFQGLMGEFDRFGYGKTESVMQLSKMFGISTTSAEEMYNLRGQTGSNQALEQMMAGGMAEGVGATRESEYVRNVQNIKQALGGELGGKAFDVRAGAVGVGADLIKGFQNMFTNVDSMNVDILKIAGVEGRTRGIGLERAVTFEDLESSLTRKQRGVSIKSPLLKQIEEAMSGGVSQEAIMNAMGGSLLEFTEGSSETGSKISGSERAVLARLLEELLEATKKQTDAILEPIEVEQ